MVLMGKKHWMAHGKMTSRGFLYGCRKRFCVLVRGGREFTAHNGNAGLVYSVAEKNHPIPKVELSSQVKTLPHWLQSPEHIVESAVAPIQNKSSVSASIVRRSLKSIS